MNNDTIDNTFHVITYSDGINRYFMADITKKEAYNRFNEQRKHFKKLKLNNYDSMPLKEFNSLIRSEKYIIIKK